MRNSSSYSRNTSEIICRICYEGESKEELFSFCKCAGTIEMVHRSCLERWLSTAKLSACDICKFKFKTSRKLRPIVDVICFLFLASFTLGASTLCMIAFGVNWAYACLIVLSAILAIVYCFYPDVKKRHQIIPLKKNNRIPQKTDHHSESELLQKQKRLLRSQIQRDTQQRARTEALRRKCEKGETRRKGSERHTIRSRETYRSAASNSTAVIRDHPARAADQLDESSNSTMQPVNEAIQRTESVNPTVDAEASQTRSELESQGSAGLALSNLSPLATVSLHLDFDLETGSNADIESRLLKLEKSMTCRLKEVKRLIAQRQSKVKLLALERILIKELEGYDRRLKDIRSQNVQYLRPNWL